MYAYETEKVFGAFAKAYETALANYEAASALAGLKHLSSATSLAILSLEEVGKMMLLDGLLFARTGDERYKHYAKGHLSHRMKLDSLELYPLFLNYLTTVDSRRGESEYKQTMVTIFADLKAKRQKLVDMLGEGFAFADLDTLKQKGFYSHEVSSLEIVVDSYSRFCPKYKTGAIILKDLWVFCNVLSPALFINSRFLSSGV